MSDQHIFHVGLLVVLASVSRFRDCLFHRAPKTQCLMPTRDSLLMGQIWTATCQQMMVQRICGSTMSSRYCCLSLRTKHMREVFVEPFAFYVGTGTFVCTGHRRHSSMCGVG